VVAAIRKAECIFGFSSAVNSRNVTGGAKRASLGEGGSGICSRSIQSGETSIDTPLASENLRDCAFGCACADRELCSAPRAGDGGPCRDICAVTPGTRNPNRTILAIPLRVIHITFVSFTTTPFYAARHGLKTPCISA
jgi:hypothetical protein